MGAVLEIFRFQAVLAVAFRFEHVLLLEGFLEQTALTRSLQLALRQIGASLSCEQHLVNQVFGLKQLLAADQLVLRGLKHMVQVLRKLLIELFQGHSPDHILAVLALQFGSH